MDACGIPNKEYHKWMINFVLKGTSKQQGGAKAAGTYRGLLSMACMGYSSKLRRAFGSYVGLSW